jgi:hypothetical protein
VLRAHDDVAVIVLVAEVEHGALGYGLAASPACEVAVLVFVCVLASCGLEARTVSAFGLGASSLVVCGLVLGAVPAIG